MPLTTQRAAAPVVLSYRDRSGSNVVSSGMGAWINTPDSVAAEVEKTNTYIATLNQEIESTKTIDAALLTSWRNFYAEFQKWYGNGPVWFFGSGPSTWWGSTLDTAADYQARAEQFRNAFVAGGGWTGVPEKATPPKPEDEKTSLIKWVIVGVSIVAVAYVAGPLVRGIGGAAAKASK